MYEKILKLLYNSAIYLLINFATLLIITTVFWLFGLSLSWVNLSLSLLISLLICYKIIDDNIKNKIISLIIALFIFIISIFVSGHVYDQSDDGNTYHKETVLMIKEGWNPIKEDYKEFAISNNLTYNHQLWAEHYPKTTWIIAASVYKITNNVETGKFYNLTFMYITFAITSYILFKIFNKKFFNIIISLLVVINPITMSQLFSYYVDGFMGLLLYLIIIYMALFVDNDNNNNIKIILAALIILITNVKFTGLAYSGLFCLGYYIYYIVKKIKNKEKKTLIKNTIYFLIVVIISVGLVGSTSYLKNTIEHSHPLYPLSGKGKVDIMSYLQPASFANKSPIEKNFYSIFSRTANIGVFNNGEPVLKLPFTYESYELEQISYDTRIGGYGVLFSGIFILSIITILIYTIIAIKNHNTKIWLYLIPLIITIGLMLFLSDSWWARYAPQLYLFILISLLMLSNSNKKILKIIFVIYSMIILYNAGLCFKNFYQHDLPTSGKSRIELDKNINKEINIYFAEDRFTGVLANLRDRNIKYTIVNYQEDNMKLLYGNYVYYVEINN